MLEQSLLIFSGVSPKKEADLWRAGVKNWEEYVCNQTRQRSLLEDDTFAMSPLNKDLLACHAALKARDAQFFASRLDRAEHYRIVADFASDCLFLDIESTGLSRYYDQITAIGWILDGSYGVFVQGQSDAEFMSVLTKAKCIVTFNGTLFDLPFIRHTFSGIDLPVVHVDLRYLARRVGLTGGQKEIENRIGIGRPVEVSEVSGEFAPVLWHRYRNGDLSALETLLKYNFYDIVGLVSIFDHVVSELSSSLGFPIAAPRIQSRQYLAPLDSALEAIAKHLLPYPDAEAKRLSIDDIVFVDRNPRLRVVGIDLTGSEKRESGWCLLDGREASTALIDTDEELIRRTLLAAPHVVSIDSPLNLPDGRTSVDDGDPGRKQFGIMRQCERILKRRGVNVYPALLPSMQKLTGRGIRLAAQMRALGLPVIESYPGAAQDIMRIPRKRKGLNFLVEGLASFGITGQYLELNASHDELDAITSAIVGVFFWSGLMERLGSDPLGDEALIIPDLAVKENTARRRFVIGVSGALGAGKTTSARYLESLGFYYCRYSEVIERLVAQRGTSYSREDLQIEGQRVHVDLGQRWLGRELIRPHFAKNFVVIDGLRYPDDHAFLTEIYGSQFVHVNLTAPKLLRRRRFGEREGAFSSFDQQELHSVESHFGRMKELSRKVVSNEGSKDSLHRLLDRIARGD